MSQEEQVASRNWHRQKNWFSPGASGRKQSCWHLDISPVPVLEENTTLADLTFNFSPLTSSRPLGTLPPQALQSCNISYQFTLLKDYITASLSSSRCQLPPLPPPTHALWWCCLLERLNSTTVKSDEVTCTLSQLSASAPTHSSVPPAALPTLRSHLRPIGVPFSGTQEHHSCSSPTSPVFLSTESFPSAHAALLSWFTRVWLFSTPWTIAHQAPLSMGFSQQEF